jgi:hypothetical protein
VQLHQSSLPLACAPDDAQLEWVEATSLEEASKTSSPESYAASWAKLKEADGILVPGGWVRRGAGGRVGECSVTGCSMSKSTRKESCHSSYPGFYPMGESREGRQAVKREAGSLGREGGGPGAVREEVGHVCSQGSTGAIAICS